MADTVPGTQALLKARIDDIVAVVRQKNYAKFTSFLNESEVYFAKSFIEKNKYGNYLFYGGCHNNKRRMLGVFPEYLDPDTQSFPITALEISFPTQYNLTHRDFLGALMGLNITRDSIGDMVISSGSCGVFLRDSVVPVIEQELRKVGPVGVNVSRTLLGDYIIQDKFKEISGTVSSLRLDSIVALICRISRERAAALIQSGTITVNYSVVQTNHYTVGDSDILSIRGYGKYIMTDRISETKKGRLFITVKQFI